MKYFETIVALLIIGVFALPFVGIVAKGATPAYGKGSIKCKQECVQDYKTCYDAAWIEQDEGERGIYPVADPSGRCAQGLNKCTSACRGQK